jgi:hypothetical protein
LASVRESWEVNLTAVKEPLPALQSAIFPTGDQYSLQLLSAVFRWQQDLFVTEMLLSFLRVSQESWHHAVHSTLVAMVVDSVTSVPSDKSAKIAGTVPTKSETANVFEPFALSHLLFVLHRELVTGKASVPHPAETVYDFSLHTPASSAHLPVFVFPCEAQSVARSGHSQEQVSWSLTQQRCDEAVPAPWETMTSPVEWSQVTPQVAAATERRAKATSVFMSKRAIESGYRKDAKLSVFTPPGCYLFRVECEVGGG